ncbi:ATP-dependent RNA helicase TDRD9 isoform X2 [Folsomia candida]|uniref:ATP-dependent RNA helicase TDRD9 isoform X2 n=1 Tax=Folsomia candida TaxID=158441 RepID=UPI0016051872|nr:ATP-dependent RNA helicase TDRD9 isoform X2 [Folsomia candida]
MDTVRIKEEPIDYDEAASSHTSSKRKRRKRRREEEEEPTSEPTTIKIKKEKDLFEPPEDEDSSHTVFAETRGDRELTDQAPPSIRVDADELPGPSSSVPNGSSSAASPSASATENSIPEWLPEPDPVPLTNFFEFSSAPIPTLENTVLENKLKENKLGPEPKIPKVAHYNAHDEVDEKKYIVENEATNSKLIKDHNRIEAAKDEEDDEADTNYDTYESSLDPNGPPRREKVYVKYNFKDRHINTSRLAVFTAKEKILKAIENHRVVIVDGFTGCGKTTQVPQFILDQHFANDKVCNIVVTQPRKIAAISVAKRVCDERNWKLGQVVGYQVGMETKRDRNDTLLTYMTTGVLLQKLIATKSFQSLTHIIIDEVHERDLESDLLLLVIKKILQDDVEGKHRHVKFVLMSATLNSKKFSRYFPMRTGESEMEESPVIKIPHSFRHRVDEEFVDNMLASSRDLLDIVESNLNMEKATIPEEMYTVAVDCIISLDEHDRKLATDPRVRSSKQTSNSRVEKRGSVLVFLPGMEEINRLYRSLTSKNQIDLEDAVKDDPNFREYDFHQWDVVPLHSTITSDEQQRVFDKPRPFHRKIILSTNIAESSVTVPDVMYVIDFCLTKSLCIDPYTNFTTLRMVWASISQCIQRKGRTGRVCDGKVFRLVTKSFFGKLPQDTKPEMLRSNLETVVLQLKKLNLGTPKELLSMALDPPVVSGIERAVANLKELGALTILTTRYPGGVQYDTCDGDLTFLGSIMTDLPIPQQCARLIMLGHCFGVMKEAIIIASALSVKNPFSTPFVRSLDAYLSRLSWSKKSCSDLFALYYVYKHWIKQFSDIGDSTDLDDKKRNRTTYNERQWARGAFVQLSVLREIKSTVELIEERLARHGPHIAPNPFHAETPSGDLGKDAGIMLKLAIAGAFYPNYFHRRRPDVKTYERDKSREISGLDLYNTVYFKGFPAGHDGKIYAKFVADYLSFGLNVPSIKFDGQKVLATFDNRGEKIGPINKGIYRAVKRRQIRDMLEISLTSRDCEKRILEEWDSRLDRRRFMRCVPQVTLPGVDVSKVYVRVTHVENPGQFWINYSSHTKALDEMVDRINEGLVHVPIHSSKVVPNAMCIAPYQGRYYRAKIVLVVPYPIDDSLVYFIDYGNTAWVKNSTLEDFSPSMIEQRYNSVPCLAVECRLSNIKPATIHGAGWHDTAKMEFQMFAENAPFVYIDIFSVSKSIISGKLIGHDDRRVEQNLNDRLVNLGFAELTEEATFSQNNHRARQRVSLQDADERIAHNKEQIGEQLDFDFVQPNIDLRKCTKTLIKGPWSPLELDFQSLCHSSNTKQVKIDNNSVNSVVLDTEPTAPISRLLVAGYVGIQDRSGSVVARDTTIMPSVPGLLSLMAMLFAPKIELRIDVRQTKYTGVLCGLGSAPHEPDLPIYPDHDVEIIFDTVIDDDDIDSINRIRYLMNLIMRKDHKKQGGGTVNLSHYQMSVREELLKLLQRRRKAGEEEIWPQEEYMWSRIAESSLVPPSRNCFVYEPKDIFAPHYKIL